jgi:hypothetical protein
VFGLVRGGERCREVVAVRHEADAAAIEAAAAGERDQVRAESLPQWQTRLGDLLEEFPEAREEMQAWGPRVHDQLSAAAQQSWVQNNTARERGQVFTAQGGNVIVHQAATKRSSGGAASPSLANAISMSGLRDRASSW